MYRFLLPLLLSASTLVAQSQRYYVDQNAIGLNNGQSWHDAFFNLHDALALAHAGDEVWVAGGIYRPADNGARSARYQMLSGVRLLGGFKGNEFFADQRIPGAAPSILSGDIGVPGDSTDNSYTLLFIVNPDTTTLIDGFTFRDAVANNDQVNYGQAGASGGALYLDGQDGIAYPTILNCTFEHNTAVGPGGAVYVNGSGSGSVAPVFRDCNFIKNRSAQSSGGAVCRQGGSWLERPGDFDNCLFDGNYAWFNGGSIYFSDSERSDTLQVRNCRFFRNYARLQSAGICIGSPREITTTYLRVLGCRFEEQDHSEGTIHLDQFTITGNLDLQVNKCKFKENNNLSSLGYGSIFIELNGNLNTKINSLCIEGIVHGGTIINLATTQYNHLNNGDLKNITMSNCTGIGFIESYRSNVNVNGLKINNNNSIKILFSSFNGLNTIKNASISNNMNTGIVSTFDSAKVAFSNISFLNNSIANSVINFKPSVYNGLFMNNKNPDGTKATRLFNYSPNLAIYDPVHYYHCMTDLDTLYADFDSGTLFDVNAEFVDTAAGDYHLLPCSPGVDAGDDAILDSLHLTTDITGAPRIRGNHVDMGAYESYEFGGEKPKVVAACDGLPVGAISLNPANGCEPFSYQWSPPAGNGPELNDLPAGQYRVTVTDTHGWQFSDTINIPVAASPQITGSQVLSNVTCGSLSGGSAAAAVSGGTAPYAFQWSNGMADSVGVMLPAGTSRVTVTDVNGCRDSTPVVVLKQGQITLMVDGTPIACHDDHNGLAAAAPANGKAPFSYLWSQGATDSLVTALGPGQYTVTVTDAFGCTSTFSFNFSNPALLQTSVTVVPSSSMQTPDGSATAMPQGGSPAYAYAWSTGAQTQQITGLAPGTYTVTITDTHGCTATASAVVQLMSATQTPASIEVKVWPNPASTQVQFQGPEGVGGRMVLYDLVGREVLSEPVSDGQARLELGALPGGVYQWRWVEAGVVKGSGLVERR